MGFRDLGNPKVDDMMSDKNLASETDSPFPRKLKLSNCCISKNVFLTLEPQKFGDPFKFLSKL
jgi:hypothetical protein